ncbi:transcriptional regulator AdcR [Clostridium puniceum]|uniref:Transcriptional regulator AdcR n=1 Tax=Clostridium puniceum TaxID=29367 RepID=A0A1S8TWU7_9CLOT|nr:MarR family transcriptional regulator [Clostridium puniceum]OOM82198.1 transcriptional regulator AdcR [Clostridium puniceum]
MSNSKLLLSQFAELYEKQDILTKLTSREFLHGYGYSEIHCIDLIGKLENPNVTKLASKLAMTTSAISKILKKLLANEDITRYQCDENKKEIYYKLTEKGKALFDEHFKRHSSWEKRDEKFFEQINAKDLKTVSKFLTEFNKYLEAQISELK